MLGKRSVRLPLLGAGAVLVAVVAAWLLSSLWVPKSPPAALPAPPPPAVLPLGSPTSGPPASSRPAPASSGAPGVASARGRPAATRRASGTTATAGAATRQALSATLTVTAAWDDGYVTEIKVVNAGSTPQPWTVTVGNASRLDVRLGNAWNATATQAGDAIILRGQPLPAGRTITAGYQVSAAAASHPRPAGCVLTAGTCRLA